jgi:hypothetical protein
MRQWIVAVLFSMISTSAWAQQDPVLRGFASVDLVIESPDEDAKACGITKSGLDTSARFVLSQSRIKIDPSRLSFIYINVYVMRLPSPDSCVYNSIVSCRTPVRVAANNEVALAEIWSRSGIGIYPRINVPRAVAAGIEDLTKQFVVEWSKTN